MPGTPTNQAATATGPTTVLLTWTDATSSLFNQIFYGTTNSQAAATFAQAVADGVQKLLVTGLTPATTYYFWILSQNQTNGSSPPPTSVSVSTPPATAPSATTPSLQVITVPTNLPLDVVNTLTSSGGIVGFTVESGSFPLYDQPVFAGGLPKAGFVTLVKDFSMSHNSKVNSSTLNILFTSTTQSDVVGAAEAVREYLQPKGAKNGFSLYSGRFVMQVQNTYRTELSMMTLGSYTVFQTQVQFDLQLQS